LIPTLSQQDKGRYNHFPLLSPSQISFQGDFTTLQLKLFIFMEHQIQFEISQSELGQSQNLPIMQLFYFTTLSLLDVLHGINFKLGKGTFNVTFFIVSSISLLVRHWADLILVGLLVARPITVSEIVEDR
jgi:hypothetical protein